jgi:hypothetical protein
MSFVEVRSNRIIGESDYLSSCSKSGIQLRIAGASGAVGNIQTVPVVLGCGHSL